MRCHDGKIWYTNIGETMTIFVLEGNYKEDITVQVKYTTLDGEEVEATVNRTSTTYKYLGKPDDVVIITPTKMKAYPIEHYDNYYDYGYWCVEINGKMYEAKDWFVTRRQPDWATHFTYYSQ